MSDGAVGPSDAYFVEGPFCQLLNVKFLLETSDRKMIVRIVFKQTIAVWQMIHSELSFIPTERLVSSKNIELFKFKVFLRKNASFEVWRLTLESVLNCAQIFLDQPFVIKIWKESYDHYIVRIDKLC